MTWNWQSSPHARGDPSRMRSAVSSIFSSPQGRGFPRDPEHREDDEHRFPTRGGPASPATVIVTTESSLHARGWSWYGLAYQHE